ncbi:MAG: hypothetical protein GX810_02425, partial [Clostridiales bacterium]|nr:hypothetical protein [Clostridiales bacterium]
MKRFLALALLVSMAFPTAGAENPLRGYDAKAGYSYALFGQYPQGAGGEVAPILWRVLKAEGGKAVLLSDKVLDAEPVQEDAAGFSGWETSGLRAWLNESFVGAAFDATQLAAVVIDDQGDRATLPDAELLKDETQGFSRDADRIAAATAYAQAQGVKRYNAKEAAYWMRTRSTDNPFAQRVVISGGRSGVLNVASPDIGVRPMVLLSLDVLVTTAGTGTLQDPWQLSASPEAIEQARLAREQQEQEARRAEEERRAREQEQKAREQRALEEAQTALIEAQAALKAAQDGGKSKEERTTLEAVVTEKQQALNKLTMTEREGFPMLTAQGFLPEGEAEFIQEDPDNGVWRYASQDLLIEIKRASLDGP